MNVQSQPSPRRGTPEQISGINLGPSGWRGRKLLVHTAAETRSECPSMWFMREKHIDKRNWSTTFVIKVEQ